VVDFLFVILELVRYLLRLRRYKRKSVEVGEYFGWKGIDTSQQLPLKWKD